MKRDGVRQKKSYQGDMGSTVCEKKGEKRESDGGNVNRNKKETDRKRNHDRRKKRRNNGWEGKERGEEMEDSKHPLVFM